MKIFIRVFCPLSVSEIGIFHLNFTIMPYCNNQCSHRTILHFIATNRHSICLHFVRFQFVVNVFVSPLLSRALIVSSINSIFNWDGFSTVKNEAFKWNRLWPRWCHTIDLRSGLTSTDDIILFRLSWTFQKCEMKNKSDFIESILERPTHRKTRMDGRLSAQNDHYFVKMEQNCCGMAHFFSNSHTIEGTKLAKSL